MITISDPTQQPATATNELISALLNFRSSIEKQSDLSIVQSNRDRLLMAMAAVLIEKIR